VLSAAPDPFCRTLANAFVIRGAALHDIYHTGPIQFIKRMP